MLIGSYWPRCPSLNLYTLAKRLNVTFSRRKKGVLFMIGKTIILNIIFKT